MSRVLTRAYQNFSITMQLRDDKIVEIASENLAVEQHILECIDLASFVRYVTEQDLAEGIDHYLLQLGSLLIFPQLYRSLTGSTILERFPRRADLPLIECCLLNWQKIFKEGFIIRFSNELLNFLHTFDLWLPNDLSADPYTATTVMVDLILMAGGSMTRRDETEKIVISRTEASTQSSDLLTLPKLDIPPTPITEPDQIKPDQIKPDQTRSERMIPKPRNIRRGMKKK